MASVSVRILPAAKVHGLSWARSHPERARDLWIVATAHGRRKRVRLGPDEPATWERAAKMRGDVERALRLATFGLMPTRMPTLAEAVENYLDRGLRDHARSTRMTRRHQLQKFLPTLGERHLDQVEPEDLLRWWAEQINGGRRDPRTGFGHLEALSQVFEHALDLEGVDVENPVPAARRRIRRRTSRTKTMRGRDERNCRPLSAEELRAFSPALLAYPKSEVTLLGLLALDAGLRIGEAMGLRWCDVEPGRDEDDLGRQLAVRQSIDLRGGASSPKSGLGRTVPLSRRLRAHLLRRRAKRPHDVAEARILRWTSRAAFRKGLAEVSGTAGLKRVVKPKDLRDTFASQLLTAGITLAWISKRLGHQTVVVTAKHYARWAEADYREPLSLGTGEVPPDLLERIHTRLLHGPAGCDPLSGEIGDAAESAHHSN